MALKTTFSKEDLKNKDFKSSYIKRTNTRFVGGRKVDSTNSNEARVLATAEYLQKGGTMGTYGSQMSTNDISMKMLESIGISILTGDAVNKKDFSLLSTDKIEIMKNPALSEPGRLLTLTNRKITAQDKFTDANDPFYVLDQEPSRARQQKDKQVTTAIETKDCVSIAASFYDINIINTYSPLKYFGK